MFFSSPFGGLEEEREELTKKYWPQLSSLCKKAGYEFVPVDMRWGITSEMSSKAATIEICLREMDRSDMIVGFFGQVYIYLVAVSQLKREKSSIMLAAKQ